MGSGRLIHRISKYFRHTELGWRMEYIKARRKEDPFHACVMFDWFQAQQKHTG